MTRLLTTGYETGDVNEAGVATLTSGTMTVVNTAPVPRAGSYCLKFASPGTSWGGQSCYKSFTLPASKTEIWVRFAYFAHPASQTGELPVAAVQDSASSYQGSVTWDVASGTLRLRLGATNGTLLATAGTAFAADSWHVIDWRTQITSASAGVSEIWLDGNRVINFSGDNTATANVNVQFLLLGHMGATGLGTATGVYLAYDDIAVNDVAGTINNGRCGDGRVILLTPNGAGSSTQWVRGGTDTGANYSQVNELPASMAQYVSSPTVGNRDLYALSDIGVAVQSINVVEAVLLAQNSDAGGGSIAPTIKSGATINESGSLGLSTSAGYVIGRWETDPNTAAAWTVAAVNAAEVGATVR